MKKLFINTLVLGILFVFGGVSALADGIVANFYDNLTSLKELRTRIAEGTAPDEQYLMEEYLEIPLNRKINFGTAIKGYFLPPETGTYYFYVAADKHIVINN